MHPIRRSLVLRFPLVLAAVALNNHAFAETAADEIFAAVEVDDLAKVKALLKDNPDLLFDKDKLGETLLHWAAQGNVEHGSVEFRDPNSMVRLYNSLAGPQHSAVLVFLLSTKLDVNARDSYQGKTPLHLASTGTRAELLLAHGADVNSRDKYGETPLHDAALSGYRDVVAVLLAHKADVNARREDGRTPLMMNDIWTDVAKLLLTAGADVNARDKDGLTALGHLLRMGGGDVVPLLRQHGGQE